MSAFEATCPACNGPLEKRDFEDGEDEINRDWWCPACKYRWMNFSGEPLVASG